MADSKKERFAKDFTKELQLARQMKEDYCDKFGKETNVIKTSDIIHKIGLIYRNRSPCKLSLIKSVGLLNAAIIRTTDISKIVQIESDLSETCRHILQQAKAKNQEVDLIKIAETTKTFISELRLKAKTLLNTLVPTNLESSSKHELEKFLLKKADAIEQINKTISNRYIKIMADLGHICEDVMGKPPCEYAIVGMGSLARCEITPYSDFEHMILLDNEENHETKIEHFKWYSVIFHCVVLNFRETIIPSLHITSLNNESSDLKDWFYDSITPQGVSFDGMMPHACKFPLGRQEHTSSKLFSTELIKPVKQMLNYLSFEADLKNGYHLADILTRTCFVCGNEKIFEQFFAGYQNYLKMKSETEIINDVTQQVKDDLNSFSTRSLLTKLMLKNKLNIKKLVYRSATIFIAALARIHNITANSSFDIVKEMANKKKVTENTAKKLRCAIAIACEMRLRVYMDVESQKNDIIDLKQGGKEKFLSIVGAVSTINYFQITYCLQCEVAKQLKFAKLHFYSDSQLVNITISIVFELKNLTEFYKNSKKCLWNARKFDFDKCIFELEHGINWNYGTSENPENWSNLNVKQLKSIADNLYSANIFDEARDFYKLVLELYKNEAKHTNCNYDIAMSNYFLGRCLNELNQPASGLVYLKQAFGIIENLPTNAKHNKDIVAILSSIGWSQIDMVNYNEALTILNQAVEIYRTAAMNTTDISFARALHNLGLSLIYVENYNEALLYLNKSLEIRQILSLDTETDRNVGIVYSSIGKCLNGLQRYEDSLYYLKMSLRILERVTLDKKIDRRIADVYQYMGECFLGKRKYAQALKYSQQALQTYQAITEISDKDTRLALTLENIGMCLLETQDCEKSLKKLEQSLQIYKEFTPNEYINKKTALLQLNIDKCLATLGFSTPK